VDHVFGPVDGVDDGKVYTRKELDEAKAHRSLERSVMGTKDTGAESIIVSRQDRKMREYDGLDYFYWTHHNKAGALSMLGNLLNGGSRRGRAASARVAECRGRLGARREVDGSSARDAASAVGNPVRVQRSSKLEGPFGPPAPSSKNAKVLCRHDGLYRVVAMWDEAGKRCEERPTRQPKAALETRATVRGRRAATPHGGGAPAAAPPAAAQEEDFPPNHIYATFKLVRVDGDGQRSNLAFKHELFMKAAGATLGQDPFKDAMPALTSVPKEYWPTSKKKKPRGGARPKPAPKPTPQAGKRDRDGAAASRGRKSSAASRGRKSCAASKGRKSSAASKGRRPARNPFIDTVEPLAHWLEEEDRDFVPGTDLDAQEDVESDHGGDSEPEMLDLEDRDESAWAVFSEDEASSEDDDWE